MRLAYPVHDPSTNPTGASLVPASNTGAATILLVEDSAFVCNVAYEILRSAGYRVLVARNAADAVRAFGTRGEVQLLLTDVVLPDRDGRDLACELLSTVGDVRAIFVSGYPENSVTRKGLHSPGWLYLPKPFSALSLLQKVTEVLGELPM